MRPVEIRTHTASPGIRQWRASWKINRVHYLQEALGLAIFMFSACFFGALLEAKQSPVHQALPYPMARNVIMGVLMGTTALFIFYWRCTAPSGSHINPAVSITFMRLGKLCRWDALGYTLFQVAGGTIAVVIMQLLMGRMLTGAPVNSVVTVPGKYGPTAAFIAETLIAFVTMSMVLFTSHHARLKKYTRIISACLVCAWVICAGPVSGFGMNPARSFASALPANTWTSFWIYILAPPAGMMLAAEVFIGVKKRSKRELLKRPEAQLMEPLEFLL